MTRIPIEELKKHLEEIVEQVQKNNEAVVVTGASGDLVRVTPLPKPTGEWKGRPRYKLKDVPYLDFPYW
ncbi:MAG TPA: hypothetical protein VEK08_01855 [Planctomycetota bacterium]|nr:hypothetical protein [Planctomycetota bacterium]